MLPTTIESFSDKDFRGMDENGTGRNYVLKAISACSGLVLESHK